MEKRLNDIEPEDSSLKPKEIPIDTFFHKIVMVRDRIRVMEQRINASDLSDEEKVASAVHHQDIWKPYDFQCFV